MARTILDIVRDSSARLGIERPEVLFSSSDRTEVELASVINDAAEEILEEHEWSLLKPLETHTGDGTTEGFDLPADYVRMPKDQQIWSSRWQRPMIAISTEDWLRLDIREYDLITGTWVKLQGQFKYRPVLASGETAQFYYISNAVVAPATGVNKALFTEDTDTFRLGDRLIELAIVAKWRETKGLPYEAAQRDYMKALARAISDDKGARIITQSARNNVRGKIAYPWSITP